MEVIEIHQQAQFSQSRADTRVTLALCSAELEGHLAPAQKRCSY